MLIVLMGKSQDLEFLDHVTMCIACWPCRHIKIHYRVHLAGTARQDTYIYSRITTGAAREWIMSGFVVRGLAISNNIVIPSELCFLVAIRRPLLSLDLEAIL